MWPEAFFGDTDLNALGAWNAGGSTFSRSSRDDSIGGVSVEIRGGGGKDGSCGGGGGGAGRLPFDAAKCSESKTFGWKALKCA